MNTVMMTQSLKFLFIDSNVQDYQQLFPGLKSGVQIFVLNDDANGVEQISEVLTEFYRSEFFVDFDSFSIHILGHGVPGCIYLGNGELSLSTLSRDADRLKSWCQRETTIQLYACNLAAGDAGEEFITKLHHITGAGICASSSKIGHSSGDGNWNLDVRQSERIQDIFDAAALDNWKYTLSPNDDTSSGLKNTVQNIDIRANDAPTSAPATIVTPPSNGTAVVQPNGTVNYTPNADFTGTDSFVYQIDQDYTIANPDRAIAAPGTTQTINVLFNDTDAQNEPLTVTLPNGATSDNGGTLVVNPDGTIDYTPATGFLGLDSFTYQIDDGNGNTDTATVKLDVRFAEPRSQHYLPPRPAGSTHANYPMKLLITTELPTASGVISFPGSADAPINFSITESTSEFSLTLGNNNLGGTIAFNTIGNNGIKIITDSGEAVNVQLVQEDSNGQSFLSSKGLDALGTEFYAGEMDDDDAIETNAPASVISVIATEDNTQVTFEAPNVATWNWEGTSSQTRTVTLNEGETFIIQPASNATSDITGSRITSTKPIAVSNGNFGTRLSGGAVDNGWDQIVPVQRTGRDYVVVKGVSGNEEVEIIATKANTQVFFDGVLETTLANPGDVYTRILPGSSGSPISITTSENTYLFQSTGAVAGRGENGVSLIPAISPSGRSRVRFRTPADPGTINIILGADAVDSLQWVNATTSTPIDITTQSGYAVKDVPGRTDVKVVSFNTNAGQSSQEYYFDSQSFIQVGILAANGSGGGFAYISGFNFGPVQASDDVVYTNTSTVLNVLANDYDTNGNPLTLDVVGQPSNGTTVLNGDGTVTYTPNPGYTGPDSFTYSISDDEFHSAQAIVYINPGSPLPTATVEVTVSADTDGDGVLDVDDIDDDNDGLTDRQEFLNLTDLDAVAETLPTGNLPASGTFQNIAGSVDIQDGSGLFGVDTTLAQGNNYIAFHSQGDGTRSETWSVQLDQPLVAGELVEISFFMHVLDNGSRTWDNPGQVHIYGGTSFGNEAELVGITSIVNSSADGWVPITIEVTPSTNLSHLTFFNTGTAGLESYIGLDALAVKIATDTDGDGVSDHLDLDSDNDGISDLYESGTAQVSADTNNDGTISDAEAAAANSGVADNDGDGLQDIFDANDADTSNVASQGTTPVDSEATPDGIPDFLDLDSDNDTIPDTVEARPSSGYVANDGDVTNDDSDGDGVIDQFDNNNAFGGGYTNFNAPNVDADDVIDALPDFRDTDSDGDSILDSDEAGPITTAPTYADPDGSVNNPLGNSDGLADTDVNPTEVDYRSIPNLNPAIDLNSDATSQGEIANPLTPTGVALTSPPTSAWEVLLYAGHFGVAGAPAFNGNEQLPQDGFGNDNGTPVLHGQSFIGQGQDTFSFSTDTGSGSGFTDAENPIDRAEAGSGITFVDNPSNGAYDPAAYGNSAVWSYVLRREVTEATTITIGEAGDTFDDYGELFVNGVRVEPAITSFTGSLPPSSVLTANVNPGDIVEIRLSNRGGNGGFEVGFSSPGLVPDPNFATTFTEGDSPVKVVDSDADVADFGETDLSTLSITPGGIQDGSAESLVIVDDNGATQTLDLSQPLGASFTVEFGGTTFDINYDGTTVTATNNAGAATAIPEADLDALIRALSYENTSENPTVGDRTLDFTISDQNGATSPAATTTITVNDVNDPPVVVNDSITTDEDVSITFNPLSNDSDVDGTLDATSVVFVNPPLGATLSPDSKTLTVPGEGAYSINTTSGEATFTPEPNFDGTPTPVEYQVADDDGGTATGQIAMGITPVNDPPILDLNSAASDADTSRDYSTTFTEDGSAVAIVDAASGVFDRDDSSLESARVTFTNPQADDVLNIGGVEVFAGGAITTTTLVNGGITYTIAQNLAGEVVVSLSGTDSLANYADGLKLINFENGSDDPNTADRIFNVTVNDGDGDSAVAVSTVSIAEVNDPPVPGNDAVTTDEDAPVTFNPLTNDSDPDGTVDPTTVVFVNPPGGATLSPDSKTLTIPGEGEYVVNPTTGEITFTPVANFDGTPTAVEYQVADDDGDVATGQINVTINPVNDAPVFDLDGDDSTAAGSDYAATFTENGSAVAIADTDTLVTDLDDSNLEAATVTFTNPQVDDVLKIGVVTVYSNGAITASTLSNGGITYNISQGLSGEVVVSLSGTDTLANYADAIEFIAFENTADAPDETPRQFNVSVNDGELESNVATSTIAIAEVNDAPTAVDDAVTTDEDAPITFNPLTNDTDVDGTLDPTSVELVNPPAGATLAPGGQTLTIPGEGEYAVNPTTGEITFTPEQDFNGTPTPVEYQVADGDGGTDTGLIQLTVNPVNDSPALDLDNDGPTGDVDYSTIYTPGTPVAIAESAGSLVTDLDGDLVTLTITLDNPVDGAAEGLGLSPSFTVPTTLTVTPTVDGFTVVPSNVGTPTDADYQAVLEAIEYDNGDVTPDRSDRTVTVIVDDGAGQPNSTASAITTIRYDSDGDGVIDSADLDDDNDGIPDAIELATAPTTGPNIGDTDGDGVIDSLDLDSDNDGINDVIEARHGGTDTDGNGQVDGAVGTDGIPDAVQTDPNGGTINYGSPANSDSDTQLDYQDLDSDNDGLSDLEEGGSGGADANGDGVVDGPDADGDGIQDSVDGTPGTYGDSGSPAVPDGDSATEPDSPDYIDRDSDNNGVDDIDQAGSNILDANNDGEIDDVTDNDNDGITDVIDDSDLDGIPDADPTETDPQAFGGLGKPDSDGDGVPDDADLDDDNDGILDSVEENGDPDRDTDGDGILDRLDLDADNDGINDLIEADHGAPDTNGDGIVDGPVGTDGIPDAVQISPNAGTVNYGDPLNSDSDANPDFQDLDSDNDSLSDLYEGGSGGTDANNDGVVDGPDSDGDGIQDSVDGTPNDFGDSGSPALTNQDGDAQPDYIDIDSDGDTVPDISEASNGLLDSDGDGRIDDTTDVDQDGVRDVVDDSDLDGTPDITDPDAPAFGGINLVDTDGDGVPDIEDLDDDNDGILDEVEENGDPYRDTDGDGVLDRLDLDADNDGINDVIESGQGATDVDGDGTVDGAVGANGVPDAVESAIDSGVVAAPVNSDNDDNPDFQDLDSDNDSLSDLIEGGSGGSDADNNGVVDGPDTDGDGIQDSVDGTPGSFGDSASPATPNNDGDANPDYIDVDSNDDGTNDIVEAGNRVLDADGDGVIDDTTDVDDDGVADVIDDSDLDGTPDISDPDAPAFGGARGPAPDADGDGIPNELDLDDDNDGIPDAVEEATAPANGDSDGDGIPDRLDLDSDNDGINDLIEAGHGQPDADGNGQVDGPVGANGLLDAIESDDTQSATITYTLANNDSDGQPDFQDLDSDNDSLSDLVEGGSGGADANGDGVVDGPDTDGDGLQDSVDGTPNAYGDSGSPVTPNNDSDLNPDYIDRDSDDNGVDDIDQAGSTVLDGNNDGEIDDVTDNDNDGIADVIDDSDLDGIRDADPAETDPQAFGGLGKPDSDGDGVPDDVDLDDDNDGILDSVEQNGDPDRDTDGDGILDRLDLDADNDGINDVIEAGHGQPDADGDGMLDGPVGANGVDDAVESAPDSGTVTAPANSDSDANPDFQDLDSDNDSLSDLYEGGSGGTDADDNGVIDGPDSDGDGIQDSVDATPGEFGDGSSPALPNQDSDAQPDYTDIDSDGDGTPDISEGSNGVLDADRDGEIDDTTDVDGDGIADVLDDSDLDGTPDITDPDAPAFGGTNLVDTDGDGVPDIEDLDDDNDGILDAVEENGDPYRDTDGDGVLDRLDLDADNDGINDVIESGQGATDADGDGVVDGAVGTNGVPDAVESTPDSGVVAAPANSDNDDNPDFQDLDSDNDSISDLVEGGSGGLDADNNGVVDGPDTDGDGIQDSVDGTPGSFGDTGSPAAPNNDGDANPDYIDIDSNEDGTPDLLEAGNGVLDPDGDGRIDDVTDADDDGIPDVFDDSDLDGTPDVADADPGVFGGNAGPAPDADGDGIPNELDLDDDNDGIPDAVEKATAPANGDTDGDGIIDRLDLDSDNDGINDLIEAGHGQPDADGNGQVNGPVGANGLLDAIESDDTQSATITYTLANNDSDGQPDFQDLDSDNDSLSDLVEGGSNGVDNNGDGLVDGPDADKDGIQDSVDGTPGTYGDSGSPAIPNNDSDANPDYIDLDSDGNGVDDIDQAGSTVLDSNNDGEIDDVTDNDNDGIADVIDDSDLDGIPDASPAETDPQAFGGLGKPDSDGDGVPDDVDLDDDNDGILDSVEQNGDPDRDTDGDGILDRLDLDADNDGINDVIEAGHGQPDADGDGMLDGPVGANGVDDLVESAPDSGSVAAPANSDSDANPDFQDLDSDNDSLSDLYEGGSGGTDADDNGVVDGPDSDGDGIQDSVDATPGEFGDGSSPALPNQDGDAQPDYTDIDSDGDGTPDISEGSNGVLDADRDGEIDDTTDVDGDGIADVLDDSDLDGTPDITDPDAPAFGGTNLVDTDGDGVPDIEDLDDDNDGILDEVEENGDPYRDTDGDGVLDRLDLDADNDGINDLIEAGHGGPDENNDGVIQDSVGSDGVPDVLQDDPNSGAVNYGSPLNSDNDDNPDFQDLDSDNDSLSDLIEGGSGGTDLNNDGVVDGPDTDGDGIPDSVDGASGFGDDGSPLPPDADAATEPNSPDYRDPDSNNDGTPDIGEAGNGVLDTDGDGQIDDPTDVDDDGIPDVIDDSDADGTPDISDPDAPAFGGLAGPAPDADGDGIPNELDLDDDNDGIPDAVEEATAPADSPVPFDSDRDGIPDRLDLDSDNDGINDLLEAGHGQPDADGNGQVDGPVGANGLLDAIESDDTQTATITYTLANNDSDGQPDFQDLDSDNDSLSDLEEGGSGGIDNNGDGLVDGPDADKDGIQDSVDGTPDAYGDSGSPALANNDGDAAPDYIDRDSDGNGVDDIDQAGATVLDGDNDGEIDDVTDNDNDGIADVLDDSDLDGIPDASPAETDSQAFGGIGKPDSDGDGVPDDADLDDDNDGILDSVEQNGDPDRDTDGDGILDRLDLDADNDGINDVVEAGHGGTDADGDGMLDGPVGANGVDDAVESSPDSGVVAAPVNSDNDANPNFQDLDSDNDSLSDLYEGGSGGTDADNNGVVDGPDSDGDGIQDPVDATPGEFGDGSSPALPNQDGDAEADYTDIDSDGDGTPDISEGSNGVLDSDGDGQIDDTTDVDGDGIPDVVDDSDLDGTPDIADPDAPAVGGTYLVDTDGDGTPDIEDLDDDNDGILDEVEENGDPYRDTDGDGVLDRLDLDADNDGINDVIESGQGATDADGDGTVDGATGANGVPDAVESTPDSGVVAAPLNSDNDDNPDFQDLDSDNDSLSDLIEGGSGGTDANNDGIVDGPDTDGDGIQDSVDGTPGSFGDSGSPLVPDADGATEPDSPDYRDPDSNNDGTPDIVEAGNGVLDGDGDGQNDDPTDVDDDGVPDVIDDSDADGTPDISDPDAPAFGGLTGPAPDADGDGVPNELDLDDDNDGIPDAVEEASASANGDTDGDGIPDRLDLDSDNDGINDLLEAGHGQPDADGNGQVDGPVGANGLLDAIESDDTQTATITYTLANNDSDSQPNFQDLDSDNDSLSDLSEGGSNGIDNNGDGLVDGPDTDGDGIQDSVDGTPDAYGDSGSPALPNNDSDPNPDYIDLDSDDNGVDDIDQAGATVLDGDDDGEIDDVTDNDNDGIPDVLDDSDLDGVPDADPAETDPQSFGGIGNPDTDGDGIFNGEDLDDDNDGIPDAIEQNGDPDRDTDGDGILDRLDLDSDNDGINDLIEAGHGLADTDGDGRVDGTPANFGNNGLLDALETTPDSGTPSYTLANNDSDDNPNFQDLDSDNDSLSDLYEGGSGGTDADGNGVVDGPDSDGDGLQDSVDGDPSNYGDSTSPDLPNGDTDLEPDYIDLDSDGDGINDIDEASNGDLDADNDGQIDETTDADDDGVPDSADDSDQDGTTDVTDPDAPGFGGLPLVDTDGDGVPDIEDVDDDNDGILDEVEEAGDPDRDTDGDGILDRLDLDSDNDGINDLIESDLGQSDADGDGRVDATPAELGSNGYPDALETSPDSGIPVTTPANSDNDPTPDFQDLDSDNDSISDLDEGGSGGTDANNDGVIDGPDTDGDGIPDSVDGNPTVVGDGGSPVIPNSDDDPEPDYRDGDRDNDGTPDIIETGNGILDPDNNGMIDDPTDEDGDGVLDVIDDSDADGIPDIADPDAPAFGGTAGPGPDADGDGIPNNLDLDDDNDGILDAIEENGDPNRDTDGDGIPDRLDLDADNDGINDVIEAGHGGTDANGDGMLDGPFGNNGVDDTIESAPDSGVVAAPLNSDSDGQADFQDLDSDNDGRSDYLEGGALDNGGVDAGDNGVIDTSDADKDGIQDSVDGAPMGYNDSGSPTPPDSDGDSIPDYRDLDSDNDGRNDVEPILDLDGDGEIDNVTDADNDGIADVIDDSDGDTILDSDPAETDPPSFGGLPATDTDGDGIPDSQDLDDDNDGIPDEAEGDGDRDTDGDGIPDSLDLDADNDGILDVEEAGHGGADADGDGQVDGPTGSNGLADVVETSPDSGIPATSPADTDGDGVEDYQDLDSDNDGINDVLEAGGSDPDGDGIVGSGTPVDADQDGILDVVDATEGGAPAPVVDTDGDGIEDYQDLDSDNDGINDVIESGNTDSDGDGTVDGPDSDGDGIPDSVDSTTGFGDAGSTNAPDSDGDGIEDYQDLDSDNDGINDVIEGGNAAADTNGDGMVDGPDSDGDGIQDLVDPVAGFGDNGPNNAPDSDGDGISDFQDLDSDNDGINDVVEGGNAGADTNGDGQVDGPDSDGDGIQDPSDPSDGFGDTGIRNAPDTDGDGEPDFQDLDSDNDGVDDIAEGGNGDLDLDGDGQVDSPDSDGDGIPDGVDPSDGFGDISGNPLSSDGSATIGGLPDTNGDGIPDYQQPGTNISTDGQGSGGSDVLTGGSGDDILTGLSDNDVLDGGAGNDVVNGGSDGDEVLGGTGNDIVNGGSDNDQAFAGDGDDISNGGSGDDQVDGGSGNDIVNGGSGVDLLMGGDGDDILNGGSGDDQVMGGNGGDILRGSRGDDMLVGGNDADLLTGGQGNDTFRYTDVSEFGDTIMDFEIVRDRIDLSAIFNGNATFGINVRAEALGSHTVLMADIGSSTQQIAMLLNVTPTTLDSSNFVF